MTRGPYATTRPMTEPWENRRKPPVGTCQRTIVDNGKARVCGVKCKGQLCDDCKAKADAVSRTTRYVNPLRSIWGNMA